MLSLFQEWQGTLLYSTTQPYPIISACQHTWAVCTVPFFFRLLFKGGQHSMIHRYWSVLHSRWPQGHRQQLFMMTAVEVQLRLECHGVHLFFQHPGHHSALPTSVMAFLPKNAVCSTTCWNSVWTKPSAAGPSTCLTLSAVGFGVIWAVPISGGHTQMYPDASSW